MAANTYLSRSSKSGQGNSPFLIEAKEEEIKRPLICGLG